MRERAQVTGTRPLTLLVSAAALVGIGGLMAHVDRSTLPRVWLAFHLVAVVVAGILFAEMRGDNADG